MDKVLYWLSETGKTTAHAVVHEEMHSGHPTDSARVDFACGKSLSGIVIEGVVVPRSELDGRRCNACARDIVGRFLDEPKSTTVSIEKKVIVTEAVVLEWENIRAQATAQGVELFADGGTFLEPGDEEHVKTLVGAALKVHQEMKAKEERKS